jgi:hypothetical protein
MEWDIDVCVGYPVRDEVIPGHRAVGWRVAFRMPIFITPIDLRARPNSGANWDEACRSFPVEALWNSDEYFELAARSVSVDKASLDITRDFIEWRLTRPGKQYAAVPHRDSLGRIDGVAIVTPVRHDDRELLAVVGAFAASPRDRASAMRNAASTIQGCGLRAAVTCWNCGTSAIPTMLSRGFLWTPWHQKVILRQIRCSDAKFQTLTADSSWSLSWLDSDTL